MKSRYPLLSHLLVDSWGSASEELLDAVEGDFHLKLPSSYRDFLAGSNGGVLPPYFATPLSPPTFGPELGYFNFFAVGVPCDDESSSLSHMREVHSGRMLPRFLPIAHVASDLMVVDCSTDDGAAYLWSREEETEPATMRNMYHLSDSLNELLLSFAPSFTYEGEENLPAFRAVEMFDSAGLRLLLEQGDDPDQHNDSGESSLSASFLYENKEASSNLLMHGADPNGFGAEGELLLIRECNVEHYDFVKLLIQNGATVPRQSELIQTRSARVRSLLATSDRRIVG
jgi:hypothetical protein